MGVVSHPGPVFIRAFSAGGGPITPVFALQDTEQSTASAAYVSANCTTGVLAAGIEYVVLYRGSFACGSSGVSPAMRLVQGATVLAENIGEGASSGAFYRDGMLAGVTVVTGDGVNTLALQFRTPSSTARAGAMGIVAIPLDQFTLNTDYWESYTNSGANEVTGMTDGGWDTIRTANFTLPAAGNYLVLQSCEIAPGTSSANAGLCRFRVGGATVLAEYQKEDEQPTDWVSFASFVELALGAGVATFAVEGGSRAAANANARRSRILVFDSTAFDQVLATISTTGASSASTTFVTFAPLNTTFTPNQLEYVLTLGTILIASDGSPSRNPTVQLLNTTDATAHCIDAAVYKNDSGYDAGSDYVPIPVLTVAQYAAAKDWELQARTPDGGTIAIGRNKLDSANVNQHLIFVGLTKT